MRLQPFLGSKGFLTNILLILRLECEKNIPASCLLETVISDTASISCINGQNSGLHVSTAALAHGKIRLEQDLLQRHAEEVDKDGIPEIILSPLRT